jgi:hypothetical protein
MDERSLLQQWNNGRSQVIHAQLAPSIVLVGILTLASFGRFETASSSVKYLAISIAAASGILAVISQFAAIREAEALVKELKKISSPSLLALKVSQSGLLLSLTTFVTVAIGIATFGFVIAAVMA